MVKFNECLKLDPNNAVVNYELAGLYFINNDITPALEFAQASIALDSTNQWYRLRYIEILTLSGNRFEVIEQQKILVEQFPNRLDFKLQLAESYLIDLQYQECINMLTEAERLEGVTIDKTIEKRDLYLLLNDYENAEKELLKLVDSQPRNITYLGLLTDFYSQYGPKEKLGPLYGQMLEIAPNDPRTHLNLAVYLNDQNAKDSSVYHLKKALVNPDLNIDHKVKILMTFYSNPAKDGLDYELLDSTLQAHPKNPKIYALYSDFLARDGKIKEAQQMLKNAVNLGATQRLILEQLILLDIELQDFQSLEADASLAMELYPNQPFGYLMTGVAYLQLGKNEEAIEVLESGLIYVLQEDQQKEQFYTYLADAYHKEEDHFNSDRYFDKALAINGKNPTTLNNYAYYLALREEKLDKALEYTVKCNSLAPNNPVFLDTWAWVLYKKGDYQQAEDKMKRVLSLMAKPPGDVLEHMGDIVYNLNRKEEALEYWQKAKAAGGGSSLLPKKIKNQKVYE